MYLLLKGVVIIKFLHISDLHFGKNLYRYSLLEDQHFWCRKLLEHLSIENYDAVVIAGDLYDRSVPSADAVALMDWFLSTLVLDLDLPVLAIAGNHDSPQRLAFGSRLFPAGKLELAALPKRDIHKVTLQDSYGPVDFFLVPYLSPADGKNLFPQQEIQTFNDAYTTLLKHNRPYIDLSRRNVLVGHGFFAPLGAQETSEPLQPNLLPNQNIAIQGNPFDISSQTAKENPENRGLIRCDSEVAVGGMELVNMALLSDFDYAALGHLHAPQQVAKQPLWYCGSPLAYSLSEEHQNKGPLAVELGPKGQVTVTPVALTPLRRLRTVSGTLDELLAPTQGGFASDDYIFIQLVADDTITGASEKLRNVYPHYLSIRYLTLQERELILEGESAKTLSIPEAFARFYTQVTGGEALSEEELTLVRELTMQKREDER